LTEYHYSLNDQRAAPAIKERFLSEVTALSKVHSLAVPHPDAIAASELISFFQAIQASLRKLDGSNEGLSNREIETAIRQVVDQALVSATVTNIFDEAGFKTPDLSIVADEFVAELLGMEHKNLAVELLNHSAREIMGVDKLRELAIVLVERIRKNAPLDWNLKESVRARMKVTVKRLLRQYGYPPDMEALATELVLEQAKVFTQHEVSNS
jgi:type I site-specific restriction-modification system R (restriction) subunit